MKEQKIPRDMTTGLVDSTISIDEIHDKLEKLKDLFQFDRKQEELARYDNLINESSFWDDVAQANLIMQKRSNLKDQVDKIQVLIKEFADVQELLALASESEDQEVTLECFSELEKINKALEKLHIEALLSGEMDANSCFLEINSGAGGTEAQDWVAMLSRMYTRWAEQHHFCVDIVDETPGEEAGFKSINLKISGFQAYGWLKTENGVHRLVRISPFDANARRHTSFASVWTYPEADDTIDIQIEEKDLRIDTYRSSGAGGQHVNKTDSAIRITHIPTGIVVSCQIDRSQHRNRAMAMSMLKARLYELEQQKKQASIKEQEKSKTDIAWGNQIRSYVLQPYQLVKDARTGVEIGNAESVLDGNLDPFLEAALAYMKTKENEE